MAQALTIGQLAQATGVSARTIRYYEEVGVLPRPGRTPAGYRQYPQQGVHRLRFIRRARALGLPLQHLKVPAAVLDGDDSGRLCWDAAGETQQISRTLSAAAANTPTVSRELTGMSRPLLRESPVPCEGPDRLRHYRSGSHQLHPVATQQG